MEGWGIGEAEFYQDEVEFNICYSDIFEAFKSLESWQIPEHKSEASILITKTFRRKKSEFTVE